MSEQIVKRAARISVVLYVLALVTCTFLAVFLPGFMLVALLVLAGVPVVVIFGFLVIAFGYWAWTGEML